MPRFFQALALASLGTLALGCASSSPGSERLPSSDSPGGLAATAEVDARESITAILKAHEENWNRHDMDLWAQTLHEDADWVHWRGGHWRGKAAIKAGHQAIHKTYYRSSRASPQRIEHLAFLTPEIALAHVRSELSGDERSPGETFRYRKTILFTKQKGVWGIRALHNTRLQGVD